METVSIAAVDMPFAAAMVQEHLAMKRLSDLGNHVRAVARSLGDSEMWSQRYSDGKGR